MGKRVLFLVVEFGKSKINEETWGSISANLGKEDTIVFVKTKTELYCDLKDDVNRIINDVNNFDYVCLINNGSVLGTEAKEIFCDYQVDREDGIAETYLPLVLSTVDGMAITLNKHIWNSMISYEPGILDLDLALKQIDSTVFGAFIPVALFFNKDYYNPELKHYQQYHLLNHLADGDNLVVGIPKITITVNGWDFKLAGISQEEKTEHFELSRIDWKKAKKEVAKA